MMTDHSKLLADLVAIESVNPVFGGSGETELAAFVEDWQGSEEKKSPDEKTPQKIVTFLLS